MQQFWANLYLFEAFGRAKRKKCRATIGNCRMTIGNCRVTIGNCRMTTVNCRMTTGDCRLATGDCRVTTGDCRVTIGNCRMTFFEVIVYLLTTEYTEHRNVSVCFNFEFFGYFGARIRSHLILQSGIAIMLRRQFVFCFSD
ncbi:MAG: hypothetical protein LBU34_02455 [Planctomycetaceae bacterium]|nr:hypothetical protein [Planctomycetaceae bacterium]